MVQYKLYYFNGRGRAELARLIFAAAGQEFEDVRFQGEQWPAFKPNTPFGQLPYLEVHDGSNVLKLAQSMAIARYLARRLNLAGADEAEQAEVDMYGEQVNDLLTEMIKVHFEKDEQKKAELTTRLTSEVVPNNLKLFETRLAQVNNSYLARSGLTWVDLHLVNVVEWLGDKRQAILEQFPHLKKHDETVRSLPNVAAWLAKRPVTPF